MSDVVITISDIVRQVKYFIQTLTFQSVQTVISLDLGFSSLQSMEIKTLEAKMPAAKFNCDVYPQGPSFNVSLKTVRMQS